jgi:hypothetical protein
LGQAVKTQLEEVPWQGKIVNFLPYTRANKEKKSSPFPNSLFFIQG